jgi:hypothetical protein
MKWNLPVLAAVSALAFQLATTAPAAANEHGNPTFRIDPDAQGELQSVSNGAARQQRRSS